MNIYLKQTLYIVAISFFFSIIRYFFIEEEYPIIKPVSKASVEIYSADASVDSLRNYLNDIKEPKIIDLELAKKIHENNLATFIDARDKESFDEGHISGAVNITFEMLEELAKNIDIEWMLETNEDYLASFYVESYDKTLYFGKYQEYNFIINSLVSSESSPADLLKEHGSIKNRETIFVIYCSGDGCSLSEELAFYMHDRFKIKKVLIYEGGMPEWIENGLPIE